MSNDSEDIADVLRNYIDVETRGIDVTHCLCDYLPPQVDVFSDIPEEDQQRLSEALQYGRDRFVERPATVVQ